MENLKQLILKILYEKHSNIANIIEKNIDIFSQEELHQIYLIINQTDIDKLKELLLYQNKQSQHILDRIIALASEMNEVEKHIENHIKDNSIDNFEQNLDFNFSIS